MDEETARTDAQQLPQSKDELLQRIDGTWTAIVVLLDGVPEPVLSEPGITGWSIKDNLAHITAWEQVLLRHYLGGEAFEAVVVMDADTAQDEDSANEAIYQHNHRRPLAEVIESFHSSHAQVLDVLGRKSFEELAADNPRGEPLVRPVIGNTYEHYEHHRVDIEQLLLPAMLGD